MTNLETCHDSLSKIAFEPAMKFMAICFMHLLDHIVGSTQNKDSMIFARWGQKECEWAWNWIILAGIKTK